MKTVIVALWLVAGGQGAFAQTNAVQFPAARPEAPTLSLKDRPEIGRHGTRVVQRDAKELSLVWGLPDPMPGSVLGLRLHTLRDGQRALGEDGPLNRTEWKDYYQALARAHGRLPMAATNAPGVTNAP